ncbi:MAG: hypothetical protein LBT23_03505 [Synergistaceae bacterium]|nr:hypothetical protein [Synergistaceae bacterium]
MFELMISSLLTSMLLLGLAASIYLILQITRSIEDLNYAQSRAEMVLAILRQPAEHCGYGLPKSAEKYRNAFDGRTSPFSWNGPLTIDAMNGKENAVCKIAYAVRTFVRTMDETEISEYTVKLHVASVPSSIGYENELKTDDINDWLLFGAMLPDCWPVRVWGRPEIQPDGSAKLPVKLNTSLPDGDKAMIPENDELFALRAMECKVLKKNEDYVFTTNDYTGSGAQPRVEGVIDVRFDLGGGGRLLKVSILTRGKWRHDGIVTDGIPKGWPEKYATAIPEAARHYRLVANQASFELKNF